MTSQRGFPRIHGLVVGATVVLAFWAMHGARADTVTMKNGIIYRCQGAPDRDNTLVYIWDGLRRIVVRDSKIDRITADNSFRTGEMFKLDQPMTVHGGLMPTDVVRVEASQWNEKGRRHFQYVGPRTKKSMEQAIIEISPHRVTYRGIDGFWRGHLATSTVPREVIVGLLGRVEKGNQAERERAVRFEIEAGWYPEAREGLDDLVRDFPKSELSERAAGARTYLIQAAASQRRAEIDVRRRAQQYQKARELLESLTEKELSPEFTAEARDLIRKDDETRFADRALAGEISKLAAELPATARDSWKKPVLEILQAMKDAPDAVRGRLDAFRNSAATPNIKPEARFALAMSGYVVGAETASRDLNAAETLWKARDLLQDYLGSHDSSLRDQRLESLKALSIPGSEEEPEVIRKLDALTRIAGNLLPPLRGDRAAAKAPDRTTIHRVPDDDNAEPTEYVVHLPPEYNPLYSYPAIVALHDGRGPRSAVAWWAGEADRRGYIVVAPQYNLPGQSPDYRYTTSEHAAVELALRDARRRYSIDSDRVFVGGSLIGGNMAWDYGLAHPDLFAGAVVVSGLPAKYVPRYLDHHEYLPLYYVTGDLAPASVELTFGKFLKPRIFKAWDVTYVEYNRRGLEDFPEEIIPIFDWMDKHRRTPYLKSFTAGSARESDNRFFGVVIREFATGRTMAPETVDMLGQNLNPATFRFSASTLSNGCRIDGTRGIRRLDLWLGPKQFDFARKVSVRINGGRPIKGQDQLDIATMLDDLRIRGDRRQVYWHKITVE
jgi:pimeloyl-ACP methyl ester carboxylesterase